MGQSKQALDTKTLELIHTDKKLFTIGSGSSADFRFKGPGVEGDHIAVKLDGHNLFIKSLGKGDTHVSSYKIPAEKVIPYKSGEAIRLGTAKPILFINLFRKFVEPHEENEAIVREAWEKAKEAEEAVAQHAQALTLQQKQAEDLKNEATKQAAKLIEQSQEEAEKIQAAARQTETQILERAERQAAHRVQEAGKQAERALHEIKVKDEENTRKVMDQAREKAKEVKAEAEREYEELLKSGRREADLLIENAKKHLLELREQGEHEKKRQADEKAQIQNEIAQIEKSRKNAIDSLNGAKYDLKNMEEQKQQAQRQFDQDKERLRLSLGDLEKQVELRLRDKRALDSEVADGETYIKEMKAEAEAIKKASEQAVKAEETAKVELNQHQSKIKELRTEIEKLSDERTTVSQNLASLKTQEAAELEKLRGKLSAEYEKRKQFEEEWFAKERTKEQRLVNKERAAMARLEGERLIDQSRAISEKIIPLISLELDGKLSEADLAAFKPRMESLISPIVQRSVEEEYQFRREHWGEVRPYNFMTLFKHNFRKTTLRMGLAAIFMMIMAAAAAYAAFPEMIRSHISNFSSQSPGPAPASTTAPGP